MSHVQTEIIPVLDHDYILHEVYATCTEAGVKYFTCSHCGDLYTELGAPALGHDFEWEIVLAASCVEVGHKNYSCTRCSEIGNSSTIPATGHFFGEIAIKTPPSVGMDGIEIQTCEKCGYIKSLLYRH